MLEQQKAYAAAVQELSNAEMDEVALDESLMHWEQVSENMLKREMRAMGVLNEQPVDSGIALGDSVDEIVSDAPYVEMVDLGFLLPPVGSQEIPG